MPIVMISRGFPAGCQAVAETVAASLACPCIGREILLEAATKLGVSVDLLSRKIEQTPSVWDRLTLERRDYIVGLQAALAEHVVAGNLVYHSYAGHILLKELAGVLRVRVVAPLEARIREAMESESLSRHLAEAAVKRYDEERARWTRTIYGVDWSEPSLYDIVLNLDQLSVDEASDCVLRLARQPRFSMTGDRRTMLQDFLLATRVRLALAASPATRGLALEVTARGGRIEVGRVAFEVSMPKTLPEHFRAEVTSVVRAVEGVREVQVATEPNAVKT